MPYLITSDNYKVFSEISLNVTEEKSLAVTYK